MFMLQLSIFLSCIVHNLAYQLTFELEDRQMRCFFKTLTKDTAYFIDIQVVSGGNYDVDFTLFDPMRKIIDHRQRSSYETVQFNSTVDGDFKLCFSNVFSSVTHKVVFFAWYNEREVDSAYAEKPGPDTLFLSTVHNIAVHLSKITNTQVRERMLNSLSFNFGAQLNSRVFYWSLGQSILIILVGIGQVFVLRSLFSVPTARYSAQKPLILGSR
ncbi:Transmembrane emp24 domain-containing protein 7 [Paragonimus heterotremus]|uniref:Transmembrane emp24 domain-containing protein 7 n=1 Tax=Paragonimus heterotremus TaxID=100268 RepID=A0A8J4SZL4_9TREM|nr:Transmembrane emp24 domain-containing protein 7 [Paragonimus heterotremus]